MSKIVAKEKIHNINAILAEDPCLHNGFLGGALGLLYYYYYSSNLSHDAYLHEKAEKLLVDIFNDINTEGGKLNGSLYSNGAAGLGYVVNDLQKKEFIEFDIDVEFQDLDKYLFEAAVLQFEKCDIDFLHGAMGTFHYFTSRVQTPVISGYLNDLATKLYDNVVHDRNGIWFKNYSLERLTDDKIDFGLAHGLSGILLLLIEAWPHLNDKAKAEEIIKDGVEFILRHELPVNFSENEFSFFPFTIDANIPEIDRINRLAWCYGDLNEVLLLYRAGKLLGNNKYIETGDRIGIQTLNRRSVISTLSADSHFCHGHAGLAQFYKCLYNETFNYKYYEAYEYWIGETLRVIDKEIENNKYAANPIGILETWVGVAFVLLEYTTTEKIGWAKAFLL